MSKNTSSSAVKDQNRKLLKALKNLMAWESGEWDISQMDDSDIYEKAKEIWNQARDATR